MSMQKQLCVNQAMPSRGLARRLRGLVCVAALGILAACGFHLKGASPLPFTTLYTNIAENSAFGAHLRRSLLANSPGLRFVSDPADAQARLMQLSLSQTLRELSISPSGQVEEYELNLSFGFQLTDAKGHLLLPPTTLQASRDIPYDSGALQATQGEIGTLFLDMQQSMVDRVVRRLTAPDVTEAYNNASELPMATEPTGDETVNPDNAGVPSTLGAPPQSLTPGLGF